MTGLRAFYERSFSEHEWLVPVVLLLLPVSLLLLAGHWASVASAWLPFSVSASAGFAVGLAYTVWLHREGRLFLRDADPIARSRTRIEGWSVPLGYIVAGVLIVLVTVGTTRLRAVAVALLGGLLLGLWPGLFANYLRLRGARRSE